MNESFEDFLEEQFISEVTSDALSLHYSLKDPAAYGIDTDSLYTEGTYLPAWSMDNSTDVNSSADSSGSLWKTASYNTNYTLNLSVSQVVPTARCRFSYPSMTLTARRTLICILKS